MQVRVYEGELGICQGKFHKNCTFVPEFTPHEPSFYNTLLDFFYQRLKISFYED